MPPTPRRLPVLTQLDVIIPALDPRHEGLRIAHLSDVHVGRLTPREHVRHAVELANAAAPDLTVMTGDYVCWSREEIPLMEEQLAGLRARHVVVTLGNHDYFASGRRVAEAMTRNGYDVLRNQSRVLDIHGAPLHVIGVDDPVTRRHDLGSAFHRVPGRGTKLALVHCPEQADALADRGVHLTLSGHTHGGQIYVKGITDRILRRMGRRYLSGVYGLPQSTLYVTTGVGYSGVRVRAGQGTRAEVALLTLRSAASLAAVA